MGRGEHPRAPSPFTTEQNPPSYMMEGPVAFPPAPETYPPATSEPAPHRQKGPVSYPPAPAPYPLEQPVSFPPAFPQNPQASSQPAPFPPEEPAQYPPASSEPTPYPPQPARLPSLITYFAPCVTFGQVAEIVEEGRFPCFGNTVTYCLIASFIGIPCIYSFSTRTKLRQKYNLIEEPMPDLLVHCLCEPCALCQEYRELKNRGLDPANGWFGNMQLQQNYHQSNMAVPPRPQRMQYQ